MAAVGHESAAGAGAVLHLSLYPQFLPEFQLEQKHCQASKAMERLLSDSCQAHTSTTSTLPVGTMVCAAIMVTSTKSASLVETIVCTSSAFTSYSMIRSRSGHSCRASSTWQRPLLGALFEVNPSLLQASEHTWYGSESQSLCKQCFYKVSVTGLHKERSTPWLS